MIVDAVVRVTLAPLANEPIPGRSVVSAVGEAELLSCGDHKFPAAVELGRVNLQRWHAQAGVDGLYDGLAGLSVGDVIQVRGNLEPAARKDKRTDKLVGFFRIAVERGKVLSRAASSVVAADAWSEK
jgi:hypothetical protein